jgi:cell wall-associated NlpC family hydrolase
MILVAALGACGSGEPPRPSAAREPPAAATCPGGPVRVEVAADVNAAQRTAAHWLAREGPDPDRPLLDDAALAALRARVAEVDGAWRDVLAPETGEPERVAREISDRLRWIEKRIGAGEWEEASTGAFDVARALAQGAAPIDAFHVVLAETPLRCVPTEVAFHARPVDPDFDRNACSTLHPTELVRLLRASSDGEWVYAHAGHSVGWIRGPRLTPALPPDRAAAFRDAPGRMVPVRDGVRLGTLTLRVGTSVPRIGDGRVLVPGPHGLEELELPSAEILRPRPALTRRALLELAFAQLDRPYGWGGRAGERDCSSFVYDLFAAFGAPLGRHSSVQAVLGQPSVTLAGLSEPAKLEAIREASREALVILHMPGHVLLYLGRDGEHDYGISSLSEMHVPCPGGPDTVQRIDRVAVTTLDVGRGSARTSFIERIDRMAVFGGPRD